MRKNGREVDVVEISFGTVAAVICAIWLVLRLCIWVRARRVLWRRELQLLLILGAYLVLARFVFFPFSRVDGQIAPLLFDPEQALSPRINLLPLYYLFDYPTAQEILLNIIGNTAMFLVMGLLYPAVFPTLDTPKKTMLSGVGLSLAIELLQLPFFDRVTDIDDLLLNTLGFAMGYGLVFLLRRKKKKT